MNEEFDLSQGKTAGDLAREALHFALHTGISIIILIAIIFAFYVIAHPDQNDNNPKILCTMLAFFIPMIGGFLIAKARQDSTARYTWLSGVLTFSIVCVWVLDLPTGNGLCEKCGAVEKLSRTFFDINHGSGLMGGDGLLVGTWMPLAMIGYSIGAKLGLDK